MMLIFCRAVLFDSGRKFLAANFEVDFCTDLRVRRRDIRHSYAPVQARRNCAAGYLTDPLALAAAGENRIVRPRRRTFFFHSKRHELFLRAVLFRARENIPPDETWFC